MITEPTNATIQAKILTNKSKTILIVPFIYKRTYRELSKDLLENDWEIPKTPSRKNILEHVNHLIPTNEHERRTGAIGSHFVLKSNNREMHELPKNSSNPFHLVIGDQEKYSFKINSVSLYLFETQVGFLTYEIFHLSQNLDTIIQTNYYLKHLFHLYKGFLYTQKEFYMASSSTHKLGENHRTLSTITESLLRECDVSSYFSSVSEHPENALVYNNILLESLKEENRDEKLGKYLFYLSRSYKESYKPAPNELKLTNNPQMIQLFENSYWAVSLEGLSNVVYLTDDPIGNQFFQTNYQDNLTHSYFYLYIIALHQRYGLLALNQHAQDLPVTDTLSSIEFEDIQKMRKEINYFILRSFFKHVSSVTHQQKLYEIIESTLQLEELKDDLRIELEALSSVVELQQYYLLKKREKEERIKKEKEEELKIAKQIQEAKKEKQEQVRREKHADTFLLISTVFVVISTITGAWPILIDFFVKPDEPLFPVSAFHILWIISIVFIVIGAIAYKQVQKKWKS